MLKCRDVAEHGSQFIDRKIPLHQLPGWYLHLFICGNCRRFIRHLRSTIDVLAGQPRRGATAAEVAAVMAAVERAGEGKPSPHLQQD